MVSLGGVNRFSFSISGERPNELLFAFLAELVDGVSVLSVKIVAKWGANNFSWIRVTGFELVRMYLFFQGRQMIEKWGERTFVAFLGQCRRSENCGNDLGS